MHEGLSDAERQFRDLDRTDAVTVTAEQRVHEGLSDAERQLET